MATRPNKRILSSGEDSSVSESSSGKDDEKTIPFLRRLRDMLKENENVISFVPGYRNPNGHNVLGRIVVHDRIEVERNVLPLFFSHNSFASLRRQLNYFSFVRLGKGRQRESTYLNDAVIELDDILKLKRRPAGSTSSTVDEDKPSTAVDEAPSSTVRPPAPKRRRKPMTVVRMPSPSHAVSEDEHEIKKPFIALDLTCPDPDEDILAGCTALLGLSQKWLQ